MARRGWEPHPIVLACVQARNEHGLTQQDLADAIGVHPVTFARWETGASIPPLDLFCRWVTLLGLALSIGPGEQPPVRSRRPKKGARGVCRYCLREKKLLQSGGVVHHPFGLRYTPNYRSRCPGTGYPPATPPEPAEAAP
ncbi:helix-turn-helix transcriptional regulator [Actinoallomurus sp. NPDC052274]|uniref:helix-turn-helix transcriptional regulator n=1 Tax=Actinoallomurus sp. NPDC052274 TaxID=3155420 RepID=UPI00343A9DCD